MLLPLYFPLDFHMAASFLPFMSHLIGEAFLTTIYRATLFPSCPSPYSALYLLITFLTSWFIYLSVVLSPSLEYNSLCSHLLVIGTDLGLRKYLLNE